MTQLEIFKATVNHQEHSEFLFYASFTKDLEKRIKEKYMLSEEENLQSFFGMYKPAVIMPVDNSKDKRPDFEKYFKDIQKKEGSFINPLGVLEVPSDFYHFTEYISPLRNVATFDEIEAFDFPSASFLDGGMMSSMVETAHKEGRVAETWVGHMYENAWQVRGYEEFLMDMIERPEWCGYILDRFMERNLYVAKAAAAAGVDIIRTGDDVANQRSLMFSHRMWQKFIKPRWASVYSAAREIKPDIQIWYHSDGNIESIIPEMIDIGLTVLNPVQPECVDIEDMKNKYGHKLVFDGTVGTQTTMPFSSPESVREVVRERKRTVGCDGALILSPTHVLEPDVPIENVEAFISESKRTV